MKESIKGNRTSKFKSYTSKPGVGHYNKENNKLIRLLMIKPKHKKFKESRKSTVQTPPSAWHNNITDNTAWLSWFWVAVATELFSSWWPPQVWWGMRMKVRSRASGQTQTQFSSRTHPKDSTSVRVSWISQVRWNMKQRKSAVSVMGEALSQPPTLIIIKMIR